MMLIAAVFSIATGVGGCGWLISARSVLTDVALWQFSNNPSNSASVAYSTKSLIIMYYTCTGPFSGGSACICVSPAMLHASGSDI